MTGSAGADPLRRRNHFVPATYLTAFTPEHRRDGTLWVYERGGDGQPKILTPDDVAVKKNLYVRQDADGSATDEVERFFAAEIEGPFARVRDDLIYGADGGLAPTLDRLDEDSRVVLARFLAFQLLRTPVEREASRWLAAISSRLLAREHSAPTGELHALAGNLFGGEPTTEQLESVKEWFLQLPAVTSAAHDWLPRTVRNARRLAGELRRLEWSFVVAGSDINLPTCDMPLVCGRRSLVTGEFQIGGAFAEPGFEATLTISPRHVLVVRGRPSALLPAAPEFIGEVRRRTLSYANRWVYSAREDPDIARALEQSRAPCYHVDVAGRVFRVGHSPEEIEQAINDAGVAAFHFRYGLAFPD